MSLPLPGYRVALAASGACGGLWAGVLSGSTLLAHLSSRPVSGAQGPLMTTLSNTKLFSFQISHQEAESGWQRSMRH